MLENLADLQRMIDTGVIAVIRAGSPGQAHCELTRGALRGDFDKVAETARAFVAKVKAVRR